VKKNLKKAAWSIIDMGKSSGTLFREAIRYIPGGVNSPVRAFKAVDAAPMFVDRAAGSKIYDVEGKAYIDYMSSWGPMILGHRHPCVVEAVQRAAERGMSYGISTELEVRMARLICEAIPSIDLVRMVNSGTEATMSAIRLARGYTRRDKIIKFEGCYHGHADSLLVKAGSGVATLGIPGSPGVPASLAALTITVPYNNSDSFKAAVERHGDDIACVIVEPVAGNMGVVAPLPGFLESVRKITAERNIILIFDEVISGFRMTYGGYQNLIGITPDLTCLGKIIGGGLPVGAFGGRKDIMSMLAPEGPLYQAGTLAGNPLAMAAGVATLELLKREQGYAVLEEKTTQLCEYITTVCTIEGIPHALNRVGSMFTLFFTDVPVVDYRSAATSDTEFFGRYFRAMLEQQVLIAPSQFEASFLSFAHTDADIADTRSRIQAAMTALR
jgi:glutamate-1-semialdehyde 2,1-aminomutase